MKNVNKDVSGHQFLGRKNIAFRAMFNHLVLKDFGFSTTAWGFNPGGRTFSVGRTFFYPKTYDHLLSILQSLRDCQFFFGVGNYR